MHKEAGYGKFGSRFRVMKSVHLFEVSFFVAVFKGIHERKCQDG